MPEALCRFPTETEAITPSRWWGRAGEPKGAGPGRYKVQVSRLLKILHTWLRGTHISNLLSQSACEDLEFFF